MLYKTLLLSRGLAVLFALLDYHFSQAQTQPLQRVDLTLSGDVVQITIRDAALSYELCDVMVSNDLADWETVDQVVIENGFASVALTIAPERFADRFFIKVVTQDVFFGVIDVPSPDYNYANVVLPAHLRGPREREEDNTPANNPVTDSGATLGRVLFYDTKLSRNETVSCSSCHVQENGFSDARILSVGFEGGLTGRNSMGLANARFYERGHFFWDERADTLEDQTLMPIQDDVEMGMDLDTLEARLSEQPYYRKLFHSTFGDTEVTRDRIALALSQFVRSMLSYQSKYDAGVASNFSNFTQLEREGLNLFNGQRAGCSACHSGNNFVGDRIDNNGLEFPYVDLGVGGVTGRPQDDGKFKMSSLRNIEMTAPYMHDGRFATLEEVVDHYSDGVVFNPNLGNQLGQNGRARPINFSDREKEALVAFLKTLTDDAFLTDPKYADPFVR